MKKDKEYWNKFVRDMPAAEFRDLFWAVLEWQARLINLYEGLTRNGMEFGNHQNMKDSPSNELKRITR